MLKESDIDFVSRTFRICIQHIKIWYDILFCYFNDLLFALYPILRKFIPTHSPRYFLCEWSEKKNSKVGGVSVYDTVLQKTVKKCQWAFGAKEVPVIEDTLT